MLYAYNTSSQAIAANAPLTFASKVKRGCSSFLDSDGKTVHLKEPGVYLITAMASEVGTGAVSMSVYKDGSLVNGSTMTVTGDGTAVNEVVTQAVVTVCKPYNCCNDNSLTIVNSGVAATASSASLVVRKL